MAKYKPQAHLNGEFYAPTVFLINTKENGVPRLCTLIPDDHEIELAGGEEFLVAYVPVKMLKKGAGDAAPPGNS